MKAERARYLARLALRFGCSVPEVRAMTQWEVKALSDELRERAIARDRERAMTEAREMARAGRR